MIQPWGTPPTPVLPAIIRNRFPDRPAPEDLSELARQPLTFADLGEEFWSKISEHSDKELVGPLRTLCYSLQVEIQLLGTKCGIPKGSPVQTLINLPLKTRTRRGLARFFRCTPAGQNTVDSHGLTNRDITVRELLDVRGYGLVSLIELLCILEHFVAKDKPWWTDRLEGSPQTPGPVTDDLVITTASTDPREQTPSSTLPPDITQAFRGLAEWAQLVHGASNVEDIPLLQADAQPGIPASILDAIRNVPLADIAPRPVLADLLNQALALVGQDRDRRIFVARVLDPEPPTLETLGQQEGDITRERVRQIESAAKKRLLDVTEQPDFAPVQWVTDNAATFLGSAVPESHDRLATLQHRYTPNAPLSSEHLWLLLHMAGPYNLKDGWWMTDQGLSPKTSSLLDHAFASNDGVTTRETITEILIEAGIVETVHDEWITQNPHLRTVETFVVPWTGAIQDKCARLLSIRGKPETAEVLNKLVDEGHSTATLKNAFIKDPRFVRRSKAKWGLRTWGGEEYSSIANALTMELSRHGEPVPMTELKNRLLSETDYEIKESSLVSYLYLPRFFITPDDCVRLREPNDPWPEPPHPASQTSLYQGEANTLRWNVTVDRDILRGSGRPFPIAAAGWLDVRVLKNQKLKSPHGSITIRWSDISITGPQISSLRLLAEAVHAEPGDTLTLIFDRNGSVFVEGNPTPKEPADLGRLLGIPDDPKTDTFKTSVATRLWIEEPQTASWKDIRTRLIERKEKDLIRLLPRSKEMPAERADRPNLENDDENDEDVLELWTDDWDG